METVQEVGTQPLVSAALQASEDGPDAAASLDASEPV